MIAAIRYLCHMEGKTDVLSGPSYQLVYTQAMASNLESLHNSFYLILFSLRGCVDCFMVYSPFLLHHV